MGVALVDDIDIKKLVKFNYLRQTPVKDQGTLSSCFEAKVLSEHRL